VVVILADNRPEWLIADMGAILAGGMPAGIYTSSTPEQIRFIAGHCEATIAIVDNPDRLARLRSVRGKLPALAAVVLMHGEDPSGKALSWSDLLQLGAAYPEAGLMERLARQRADDACTLIYTSGTTGDPRAVMLTHANLTWTAERVREAIGLRAGDSVVSYLPLAHIAEQLSSIHGQMLLGGCTWFTKSMEDLGDGLRHVRPDYFLGVPRVWEQIMARMTQAGSRSGPLRRRIVRWARRQGLAGAAAARRGHGMPLGYRIANRMIFATVRGRLGLDRSRYQITSAAPASPEMLEFFLSLGLPLYELYGLSESTGPVTVSVPGAFRTGSVGRVLDGTELRIEADGEVLVRGPHVFKGYFRDPVATAAAIDGDGWLHTGDIGALDREGYLTIIDRKKDLIACFDGQKIAPQKLEGRLRSFPGVAHAAVFGLYGGRPGALLFLDAPRLVDLRVAAGSFARDRVEAAHCPKIRAFFQASIDDFNAAAAPHEHIVQFAVLSADLTIEGGELTPTMKVKRRVLREKYAAAIASLSDRALAAE
jgi:long-subunit acyl-CoA synthetase (AMP-forming)